MGASNSSSLAILAWSILNAQPCHSRIGAQASQKMIPGSAQLAHPSCTCNCCFVMRRTMAEMMEDTGASLKCAMNEAGEDVPSLNTAPSKSGDVQIAETTCSSSLDDWRGGLCAMQKTGSPPLPQVLNETSDEGTDYNRYCFYECQPYDFTLGSMCVPISNREVANQETADGNGKDVGLLPEEGSDAGVPVEILSPSGERVNMLPSGMLVPLDGASPAPAPASAPPPAQAAPEWDVSYVNGLPHYMPPGPNPDELGARRRGHRSPVQALPPATRGIVR